MPSREPVPGRRLFSGALLASTGLQLAEQLLPRIPVLPWLRPGLSWVVILPFLLEFGVGPASALLLSRNLLSMAFGGQPASTFLISSVAGSAALLLVGGPLRFLHRRGWLGDAGASVALACAFNLGQLVLVAEILVGDGGYLVQAGPLLLWSVLSGLLVGWLASGLGRARGWVVVEGLAPETGGELDRPGSPVGAGLALVAMIAALAVPSIAGLSVLLAAALAWGGRKVLASLVASWPLLPYLAWFHLAGTPGSIVLGTTVTREGLGALLLQALRLWCFSGFGRILADRVPWTWLSHTGPAWIQSLALVSGRVPRLFGAATGAARAWWKSGRRGGASAFLEEFARRLSSDGAMGPLSAEPRGRT